MPVTDDRINHYCNTRDVTRYYKAGSVQAALTPTSIATTVVTMASAANAELIKPGDVLKLSSTQNPRGEFIEVINVTGTAVNLASAVTGTYTTGLSVIVQSIFTPTSSPSTDDVLQIIADMEGMINDKTKDAWMLVTMNTPYYPRPKPAWDNLYPVKYLTRIWLKHKNIKTFVSGTDKFYVFDGNTYVEWVATRTNSRNGGDYWLNEASGFIDIYSYAVRRNSAPVKIDTYRYGKVDSSGNPNPPREIRQCCAMLVAAELLSQESAFNTHQGGVEGMMTINDRIGRYREEAERIMNRHIRVQDVG